MLIDSPIKTSATPATSATSTPPLPPGWITLATADRCRYGIDWCKQGAAFHDPCSTGWTELVLPGHDRPEAIIEIAIESYDADQPVLVLCPEGNDAATITSDQLRKHAQAVEDYAPVMRAIADQYDAIMQAHAAAAARPHTEDEAVIIEKYRKLRAQGWSFELVIDSMNAVISPDPVAAMMLLVDQEPDPEIRRQLMAGVDSLVGAK